MQIQRRLVKEAERKGIEEAIEHIKRGWFPINRKLFLEIRDRLTRGVYDQSPHTLLEDLKKDHALFTIVLSQLGSVASEAEGGSEQSPAEVLASLERERLTKVLTIPESVLQMHSFDPAAKAQAMRLKHSVISASTAELVAEKTEVNPDVAFLCASVRQLGLNLVAWNYPRIYGKALSAVTKGEHTLEETLFRMLGFSPLQLGIRAAVDWSDDVEVHSALSFDEDEKQVMSETSKALRRCCEFGELVAQSTDPEYFPSSVAQLASISDELVSILGKDALELIQKRVETNGASYQALPPNSFKLDLSGERAAKLAATQYGSRMLEQNSYAKRCPEYFQDRFLSVYESVVPGRPSPTAVKELVELVIPSLGFTRGCVYLVDSRRSQAVPMLRIGNVSLDRFRALNCQESGAQPHPVVEALSYSAPIVQEDAFINGDRVSHVTGVFGSREKVGILYLEMSDELSNSDRQQVLLYFKAIRQCLNDCLNMR